MTTDCQWQYCQLYKEITSTTKFRRAVMQYWVHDYIMDTCPKNVNSPYLLTLPRKPRCLQKGQVKDLKLSLWLNAKKFTWGEKLRENGVYIQRFGNLYLFSSPGEWCLLIPTHLIALRTWTNYLQRATVCLSVCMYVSAERGEEVCCIENRRQFK
jgi:hypothetical protein